MSVVLADVAAINVSVNAEHRKQINSCLITAKEKTTKLRDIGIDASVLIVRLKGRSETHAIVIVRLEGNKVYFLDNTLDTLATSWFSLYQFLGNWKEKNN